MVLHIVLLNRELIARQRRLALGKELCDAEHLLKSARMVARCRQKILFDLAVPTRCQRDILDVSRRLTIQNSADKELHGFCEAGFHIDGVVTLIVRRGGEVVFFHLTPGSLVTTCENNQLHQSSFVAARIKSGRVFL